jgi:hypothetical protein
MFVKPHKRNSDKNLRRAFGLELCRRLQFSSTSSGCNPHMQAPSLCDGHYNKFRNLKTVSVGGAHRRNPERMRGIRIQRT